VEEVDGGRLGCAAMLLTMLWHTVTVYEEKEVKQDRSGGW
jgi:hypothetical protein